MNPPKFLGSYQLIEKIGEGGLAEIHLALKDGKPIAVKFLKSEQVNNPAAVASFVREVRIAEKLGHPNIPRLIDQGKIGDTAFVVLELIAGINLEEILADFRATGQSVPLPLTLFIVRECARTLSYLHQTTVFEHSNSMLFHGDISPKNIMLTQEGYFNLVDFGSAGQSTSFDPNQAHFGKLHYMPPDVIAGKAVNCDTDTYSLAVMTYYLLYDRVPFAANDKLKLMEVITHEAVPKLSSEHLVKNSAEAKTLQILFNRALNKDPRLRFRTVDDFCDQLFTIKFNVEPPNAVNEVPTFYTETTRKKLRQMRERWSNLIGAADQEQTKPGVSPIIESLLARVERRRNPRVATDPKDNSAEVILPKENVKLNCEVHELSSGGMLVNWQSVKPQIGQLYLINLKLAGLPEVVRGFGCLRYEIRRRKRSYVGMECRWAEASDSETVTKFVSTLLQPGDTATNGVGQNSEHYLDVYFRSIEEFQAEFEKNMRFGGLFLFSPKEFQRDNKIILRVQLPNRLGKILLEGKVVHCSTSYHPITLEKQHGLGVELKSSEAELRQLFQL